MSFKEYIEKFAVKYSIVRNDVIRVLPKILQNAGLKILCAQIDIVDLLLNRRSDLTPPCSLRLQTGPFIDARYYVANGEEFFRYFKSLCNIQPTNSILDVGCGFGQLAAPLSKFMISGSRYEGFDIVRGMIEWCTNNISNKYPNIRFQFADVFNKHYNPNGKQKAWDYRFPYSDSSFDFVFLKSVFTHMLPRDMSNYLSEVSRVLKKNGRCLTSYFLLNSESTGLIKAGISSMSFSHALGNCQINDAENPEYAVAYNENYVRALYKSVGLSIWEPIRYGSWCRRNKYLSYQDLVVASRSNNSPPLKLKGDPTWH